MSETAHQASSGETPRQKRPYVAPTVILFGSVEDFTKGTGTSTTKDANRITRVKLG